MIHLWPTLWQDNLPSVKVMTTYSPRKLKDTKEWHCDQSFEECKKLEEQSMMTHPKEKIWKNGDMISPSQEMIQTSSLENENKNIYPKEHYNKEIITKWRQSMRRNDKNNQNKMNIDKYEIYIENTDYIRYDCHYFQVSLKSCFLLRYEIGASRKTCFDRNIHIISGDITDLSWSYIQGKV